MSTLRLLPILLVSLTLAAPLLADDELTVTIDAAKTHQTMTGFGTCGMHWTAGKMFSDPDLPKLYVDDLGASVLRWSVPTGVLPDAVEKPEDISYKNFKLEGKGAEGVKAALDYVAAVYARDHDLKVVASIWSPPGWMKTNGKTGNGGKLKQDCVVHYAHYLAQWVLYMKEVKKVPVYAVSPQNELAFKEFYDSCQYTPEMFRDVVIALGDVFKEMKLDVKIFGPEDMTEPANRLMSYVKKTVEDPKGKEYFKIVASHGYIDGIQPAGSASGHDALARAVAPLGLELWMSETSGDDPSWLGSEHKDKKGNTVKTKGALTLASRMHNAFVHGNVSAWIYWCLAGDGSSSSKAAALGESLTDMGKPTAKYYATKQFSKFIRPGAVRVDALPEGENDLLASAYVHPTKNTVTVVLINMAEKDAKVNLTFKACALAGKGLEVYRSSSEEQCKKLDDLAVKDDKATITLPAQSMVTLVGQTKAQAAGNKNN